MTAKEFAERVAFAQLEPFGELRADYRSAQITAMILNVQRDTKRHPQPYEITDFLLFSDKPKRKQTVEEQKSILTAIAVGWSSGDSGEGS